ncbi:MAG: VacJ family lipoprotein [Elusimicrobiota bacterium]
MRAFALSLVFVFAPCLWASAAASDAAAPAEDAEFGDFEDEFGGAAEAKKVFDPLRGYNRFMFKVNDKFYYYLLRPLALHYRFAVPKQARTAVSKSFHNLYFPVRFVNTLLQLKFKKAGMEFGRFVVNSSVGVGGLFDPAGRYLKWRPSDEDFGQTLGHYGMGGGFPVVLPLLGPSNVRDGLALAPDALLNPLSYAVELPMSVAARAGEKFNYASLHLGEYESVKKDALDPYTFLRDAYEQNRDKKIQE